MATKESFKTYTENLKKYLDLDQRGKIMAEYVWIDAEGGTRSKSRVSVFLSPDLFPALRSLRSPPPPRDKKTASLVAVAHFRLCPWPELQAHIHPRRQNQPAEKKHPTPRSIHRDREIYRLLVSGTCVFLAWQASTRGAPQLILCASKEKKFPNFGISEDGVNQ